MNRPHPPRDERDQLRDHEYDGIREFDNRLPNWWLFILYATVAFAVLYWSYVHTLGAAPTPEEQLQAEYVAAAEAALARTEGRELTDESLRLRAEVPARVQAGRDVFEQFCVVCHLSDGSGSVGPNLTDAYWLHGSRPLQIHDTVTNGITDKGMAAWGPQLGPTRISDVVAFVLTLKNTNRPGKEPEGQLETGETVDDTAPGADDGSGSAPADSTAPVPDATPTDPTEKSGGR